jgi:hypothetical protein
MKAKTKKAGDKNIAPAIDFAKIMDNIKKIQRDTHGINIFCERKIS